MCSMLIFLRGVSWLTESMLHNNYCKIILMKLYLVYGETTLLVTSTAGRELKIMLLYGGKAECRPSSGDTQQPIRILVSLWLIVVVQSQLNRLLQQIE